LETVCLGLEGVLIPEVWVEFAERAGINALESMTQDVADYDVLMRRRLDILAQNGLALDEIHVAIAAIQPLAGAEPFLQRLRKCFQVVILTDSSYKFTAPLMRRLSWLTIFYHTLVTGSEGALVDCRLRVDGHKPRAVKAFKAPSFHVLAGGDSPNDVGILFRSSSNVEREFPNLPVVRNYDALFDVFDTASARLRGVPLRKGSRI
jgi:phosphoserine/homoserine phosphotransferase